MKYDFSTGSGYLDAHNDLKISERTFVLSPTRWRSVAHSTPLTWTKVAFTAANRNSIPQSRGLYAFVVVHESTYFPPHGYLMYIGITGDDSSNRTLRIRYGEYLREKDKGGRAKIVTMLQSYPDDTYFFYAPITDRRRSLPKIEDDLLSALIPPCNEKFAADIAKGVKALR